MYVCTYVLPCVSDPVVPKMLTQLDRLDPDPMQAENAESAGVNRFPIRPATFARSAAHAQ